MKNAITLQNTVFSCDLWLGGSPVWAIVQADGRDILKTPDYRQVRQLAQYLLIEADRMEAAINERKDRLP